MDKVIDSLTYIKTYCKQLKQRPFHLSSSHLVSIIDSVTFWYISQLVVDHLVPLSPHQHTLVDVVW